MTDLAGYSLAKLWEDGELVTSRAMRSNAPDLLVTVPLTGSAMARLQRALSFRDDLDPAWAVQPRELVQHAGHAALISCDCGADLLARQLGSDWSIDSTIKIAIGIASALRQLHARGLVHKDIKPANIHADPITGHAWLTGFGIASRLPRERQPPVPPEVIEGTLAYMAPEQTGRMNRSIDSRSDLYALGVTLYELLAGVQPFVATDPMEWVHAHIARQPAPLRHPARAIPRVLSDIVMKLLAKTPEARYQTAHGVEQDLRRVLGDHAPFELGEHDASDRLLIPEKLYGRETDIDVLLASFERVVDRGTTELVLVSGYSGIGKSSVVNELHRVLVPPRGLYASGKFDQYKRDIPYATLAQAFHMLVRHVLGRNETEIRTWREKLTRALGNNGQLIANLVPELELVIGPQPAPPELAPEDANVRFRAVVCKFLAVFAQPQHPLALFLDDLQWLDAATLELLEHLVGNSEVKNLLLVGAYRENEVDAAHPLARTLARIRGSTAVREIVLSPLSVGDLTALCSDTLHVASRSLAELVHEKTGGNPFFSIQFITALADERLISFDPDRAEWRWDIDAIRAKRFTDNVVELMASKLSRLPAPTRTALGHLACLGHHARTETLRAVYGEAEVALEDAVVAGLVTRGNDNYAFVHDRVHEAAYSLIPVEDRANEHLRIGRILADRSDDIFEIVNHLDRGAALITSLAERERVAELNGLAAKRAKASMAYEAAHTYVAFGQALIDPTTWERNFRLAFDLELLLAESEFLTADLQRAEDRLDRLAAHANDLADRAAVIYLQTTLYTAMAGRTDRAIQICLEFLRHLGIECSPHPEAAFARAEYDRLIARVAGRTAEQLLEIPISNDVQQKATLDVLVGMLTPAFNSDHNFVSWILCRLANLSFEHGYTNASPIGFAFLGMIALGRFENYELGHEVSKLAVALSEQRGLTRYRGRIHHALGTHVLPFLLPLSASEASIRRGMQLMFEDGDVTYSAFGYCGLITNLLGNGTSLEIDDTTTVEGFALMRRVKFDMGSEIMEGHFRIIRALRGQLPDPCVLEIDRRFVSGLAECMYWTRTTQACFLFGDLEATIKAVHQTERNLVALRGFYEEPELRFYGALAYATTGNLEGARMHREPLARWAVDCPHNFTDRVALIDAELARVENRPLEAMEAYERAIRASREAGFIHHEALGFELASRFYAARGFDTIARTYHDRARSNYLRWGAIGKVHQLDRLQRPLDELSQPRATIAADLDLVTMVKTSEAVTTEIDLEKLIETLMVIALEHAGAERGLLILPHNGELHIEAEANAGGAAVTVRRRRGIARHPEVPESLIHYVSRSQELVLLDDARSAHEFSSDPYLRDGRSRSVVCVPLVKQAELIGLLYLENNLTAHVFTTARIAVLRLLASQAATSLENASLEEENATLGEKESLLKEVHHRVKNNLQLISSLLNLQASRVSDPAVAELFAESRNRVRAMALVHENLYRAGNFARIPMATHIRTLCAHLSRAYGLNGGHIALTTTVGDVHLEMNRAVSCGLIINELLSNALKHGFPNNRAGRVWIEFREDQASYILTVGDDGVGLAESDLAHTDSLGLQLVRDLTDQLHGTLETTYQPGATFTITFPT